MVWSDADGRAWEVVDYHFAGGKRKKIELGHWSAEGRAFVPHQRAGTVLLFEFSRVAYRDTAPRTLAAQFAMAKPVGSTAAERMQRNG
jgi:hypothetical protein